MFKKKVISALLLVALFVSPFYVLAGEVATAASSTIKILLDGKEVRTDVNPKIVNGRTLVPYSSIVSALGGTASWDGKTNTVTATKGSTTVKLTVNSKIAYINDIAVTLDTAPQNTNSRILVPIRVLSEAFGQWVSFEPTSNTVVIKTTLTVTGTGGTVTLTKKPERIVTLSSSDTEIIYALGGKVVGRSTTLGNVYPPEAKSVTEVGTTHGINFETLATLKPDLVIASTSLKTHQATIEKLGAQIVFNSHNSFTDIQASVRLYGKVLGNETAAEALINKMNSDVKGLKKPANDVNTLIVYGAPGSFVVALPSSYPGSFLELAGGKNVASAFPKMETMPQYAELSLERIIAANPDLILMITHGDPTEVKASFKREFENNSAWKELSAVKNDRFEILPQDLFAANPGIRAPKAIETINTLLLQVD